MLRPAPPCLPRQVKGAVFIKYNSASGDADLSGYAGGFRGVLFTPTLPGELARTHPCPCLWTLHGP